MQEMQEQINRVFFILTGNLTATAFKLFYLFNKVPFSWFCLFLQTPHTYNATGWSGGMIAANRYCMWVFVGHNKKSHTHLNNMFRSFTVIGAFVQPGYCKVFFPRTFIFIFHLNFIGCYIYIYIRGPKPE